MSTQINTSMNLKDWSLLLILSCLWGGSFFFVELIVASLPALTIVFTRVFMASIALWGFAVFSNLNIPTKPTIWLAFLLMGILNNVIPFTLIVWGQSHISSGLASILNATTPLFIILVAGCFLSDEKFTTPKVIGVILGFIGTVIMIGPQALQSLNTQSLAQFAILGAAISYAFATVYGRRFKALNLNPIILAAGQTSASALILLPIVLVIDHPFSLALPSLQVWVALVSLALLSTAFAYILYFKILASAGATNLGLVTFLIPVIAILLGVLFLNESLNQAHIYGMGLIAFGLIIIDGKLFKIFQSKSN